MRKTVRLKKNRKTYKQKGGSPMVTIIGVAGGSGSGKTDTAHEIQI